MISAVVTVTLYDVEKLGLTSEQDVRAQVLAAFENKGFIYEGEDNNFGVNYIDFINEDGEDITYPVFSDNGVWR